MLDVDIRFVFACIMNTLHWSTFRPTVNPNENALEMAMVSLTFDPSLASLTVANGGMFNTFFSAGTRGREPGIRNHCRGG